MEFGQDYFTALTWVTALMHGTDPADLHRPTPCTEFTVRALQGHLLGTAHRGLGTARGISTRAIPHVITDIPDEALAATYAELAVEVRAAWLGLAPDDQLTAPWGPCTALEAARGFTVETVTHGWDLAVATGQPTEAPDGIAARCLHYATTVIPARLRGVMYADPVPGPAAASPTEQLAHLLGHDRS